MLADLDLAESPKITERNDGLLDSCLQEERPSNEECLLDSNLQENMPTQCDPVAGPNGLLDSPLQENRQTECVSVADSNDLLDSPLQENMPTTHDPVADSSTPKLGGTEVEQPSRPTPPTPAVASTCSPRPSGIVKKFLNNKLSLSSLPKKPTTRKSFKDKKPKTRSVDRSPAPANAMKQKRLEEYFVQNADWTNESAGNRRAGL